MPRGSAITVENNFTKGLITEFTAMNFPENAVTEGDNCVFSELGSVTRRLGADYEEGGGEILLSLLSTNPNCYTEFEWSSVGNDGTRTFVVQQIGNNLRFFENDDLALSTGLKAFSVNLTTFQTPGTTITQLSSNPCQFTSGKGYLFVVHPFCDPFYVSYNQSSDTITSTRITIQIRDFEGVVDGLENATRPTTLTNLHQYNLYNQGWYQTIDGVDATTLSDVYGNAILLWDQSRSDFPSNSDIWWVYKGSSERAYFGETTADSVIAKGLIGPAQIALGNTPAPKGHFIYNAFNINRTAVSGIAGLPSETSVQARPSSVAFFAGRAFYAGTAQDGFSDKIYFTQIIESDSQLGRCYQANDPTSEIVFDLLDSDGGVILLPTIERVISLKVVGESLIVIGTNGIFVIRGTENGPFRATDYTVEYVSTIGGTSHLSVVDVSGELLWWNNDGLYNLTKDQLGISFAVQNVSKQTIQSVIDSVPPQNKLFVKGAYNSKRQVIQWIFSDQLSSDPYSYNRILELNVVSKAFYTHTLDQALTPIIRGIVSLSGFQISVFGDVVTDNTSAIVTDNLGEPVTVDQEVVVPNIEIFKYPTTTELNGVPTFTYSELNNENHVDWFEFNDVGVNYTSFFVSGYRIRGEFLRAFSSTPIMVVLRNLDLGRLLLSGIWDYGWRRSTTQQLYLTRPEVDYLLRRVKLRGKGRSLQLRFESDGAAPFDIVGWSTFDTGGQQP